MKRDFLKELGIEDEAIIQKIMDANGKDVEAARSTVSAKDTEIEGLKQQISQRDTDMQKLREELTAAQADAGKLPGVSQTLADLQTKYTQEKADFEKKLSDQAYEFAVREKVGELKFTSKAAKEAFISTAIAKQFKMDGETLQGYADFLESYKKEDPGAFEAEKQPESNPKPRFAGPTNPPDKKHVSLSELMRQKNENPNMTIDF